jgi:hypothetical protein
MEGLPTLKSLSLAPSIEFGFGTACIFRITSSPFRETSGLRRMFLRDLEAEDLTEQLLPACEHPFTPCFAAPSLPSRWETPRFGSVTSLPQVPVGPYDRVKIPPLSSGHKFSIEPALTRFTRCARAVRMRAGLPRLLSKELSTERLKHRVVTMADDHQVRVLVTSALFARKDVMDIKNRRAVPTEKTAATTAIARENTRSCLCRDLHGNSHCICCQKNPLLARLSFRDLHPLRKDS